MKSILLAYNFSCALKILLSSSYTSVSISHYSPQARPLQCAAYKTLDQAEVPLATHGSPALRCKSYSSHKVPLLIFPSQPSYPPWINISGSTGDYFGKYSADLAEKEKSLVPQGHLGGPSEQTGCYSSAPKLKHPEETPLHCEEYEKSVHSGHH